MIFEKANNGTIIVRDAQIMFKDFTGKVDEFNATGKKSFALVIDDADFAQDLADDGWNIKKLNKRHDDDPQRYYTNIAVNFISDDPDDGRNPTIKLITGKKMKRLNNGTVASLDSIYLRDIQLAIRPSKWDNMGRHGVKGYLKTMYATAESDEFEDEYRYLMEDDSVPPWQE